MTPIQHSALRPRPEEPAKRGVSKDNPDYTIETGWTSFETSRLPRRSSGRGCARAAHLECMAGKRRYVAPCSARTIHTPSTIVFTLPNAESRGRYLSSQSGATMMSSALR